MSGKYTGPNGETVRNKVTGLRFQPSGEEGENPTEAGHYYYPDDSWNAKPGDLGNTDEIVAHSADLGAAVTSGTIKRTKVSLGAGSAYESDE